MFTRERPFDDEDWSRLARYLAGEQDEATTAATRVWLATESTVAREVNEGLSTWHAVAPLVDAAARERRTHQGDTERALATLTHRVKKSTPSRTRLPWRLAVGVAAGLTLVGVPLAYRAATSRTTWHTYATGVSERSSILLADGSRVELRASSRLEVRAVRPSLLSRALGNTDVGPRVVRLEGEAIFNVTHMALRPFRVLAGAGVAEDLGTVFLVRAYPGDASVRVAVREGAVAVRHRATFGDSADYTRPAAILAPGDMAIVESAGAIVVTRNVDVAALDAWSGDRLVFQAEPLRNVLAQLNRTFGGRAAVHDAATAERRVTLDMPARTLEAALRTLAALLDLELDTRRDSIVMRPIARRTPPSP